MKSLRKALFLTIAITVMFSCGKAETETTGGQGGGQEGVPAIQDKSGMTVKGMVSCDGTPLQGVVVSDGIDVTETDSQGCYWLPSKKKHGYVFVSLPTGYTAKRADSKMPGFWKPLEGKSVDRVDFELEPSPIATGAKFTVVGMTDLHLANRTSLGDEKQFNDLFVKDLKEYIALSRTPMLGVNMGDVTFDLYWHENNYDLTNFVNTMKGTNLSLDIFYVPGNHDNDEYAPNDLDAEKPFKEHIGPTYYSFNAGGVHFLMLDSNVYINDGGAPGVQGKRNFNNQLTAEQHTWIDKDLAKVKDKNATLVVCTHCPVSSFTSSLELKKSLNDYDKLVAHFTKFNDVHFLTGHTHNNYNMVISDKMMEHNVAAVCATWWWTVYQKFPHLCKDGTPGGYELFEFEDGKLQKWNYRGVQYDNGRIFRTYDSNRIKSWAASSEYVTMVEKYSGHKGAYDSLPANSILINVWGYDSKWKVEAKENGKTIQVTHWYGKDPYHLMCYDMPNKYMSYPTGNNYHMFYAQSTDEFSPVTITVTDRWGTTYTETVSRPKSFINSVYKEEWK